MMNDLELLREMFKDTRLHVGIGTISQLGLSLDGNTLRARVKLLPEEREINAVVSWEDVCDVSFPEVDDLVLVAFVDGDHNEAFVIKSITNKDEPIPTFAQSGHKTAYARPGKKAYFGSDTKIGIARPGVEPTEPLTLGNVLISGLTALANAFLTSPQIGQCLVGPVFLDPSVRTDLQNFMSTYLTTAATNIVSQISFTERGT